MAEKLKVLEKIRKIAPLAKEIIEWFKNINTKSEPPASLEKMDNEVRSNWESFLEWLKGKNPLARVIDQTSNKFKEAGKELITDAQQKLDDSCAKAMREFDDILGRHRLEAEKQIARLLWLSFALIAVVGVLLLGIAFVLFRVI